MTDTTTFVIGADTTGRGYASMTIGVTLEGNFSKANREAAKREAIRRWAKYGHQLRMEQLSIVRIYTADEKRRTN